jgi:NAD(P)H dehydrogenase (quinone)
MTIAITGATGQVGRLVVSKLKERVPAADIFALAPITTSPARSGPLCPASIPC